MKLNKSELKELKTKLPKGYRKIIHVKSGYSFSMIDQVLRGVRFNDKIIDCAFELVKLSKKKSEEKYKQMMEILNIDRNRKV
jgi:hypothetical protein